MPYGNLRQGRLSAEPCVAVQTAPLPPQLPINGKVAKNGELNQTFLVPRNLFSVFAAVPQACMIANVPNFGF